MRKGEREVPDQSGAASAGRTKLGTSTTATGGGSTAFGRNAVSVSAHCNASIGSPIWLARAREGA
jgi:hypothetical protein